jgi:hypothetical protein
MNTEVKIYNIERKWNDEPNKVTSSTQVAVGACPFEVWGDEPDEWTESQKVFDLSIFHFFESLDELKSYCDDIGGVEWRIISYEFQRVADLSQITLATPEPKPECCQFCDSDDVSRKGLCYGCFEDQYADGARW